MTTDEWQEISKLIKENDFYKLAEEISIRTYNLDMDKQELDSIMKEYIGRNKNKRRKRYV